MFLAIALLNLMSIVVFSFTATTTLRLNLRAAIICWVARVLLQTNKYLRTSSILPSNSPWYLIPFLSLVEAVRVIVRPITLCFRLLANLTAGHVLISLICKMEYFWLLGSLFGLLELIVAIVQAFVFSILVSVYLEESFSH